MRTPPLRPALRSNSASVAIFARAPLPGRAKTRLIPLLGEAGAARFQSALLADTLQKVQSLRGEASLWLYLAGGNSKLAQCVSVPPEMLLDRQTGTTLGDRLELAFRRLFRSHQRAVIIGTDSPLLPARLIRLALRELRACNAVLGPCPDGGYYLIGLRNEFPAMRLRGLLRGVRWSTHFAFQDTLQSLTAQGLACSVLDSWDDVDRPADLLRLRRQLARDPEARRAAPETWDFLRTCFQPSLKDRIPR